MAEEVGNETEEAVDAILEEGDRDATGPSTKGRKRARRSRGAPSYAVVGSSKIPVSKAAGKMWKSRRDSSMAHRSQIMEAWEEATRYYANDQLGHRWQSGHGSSSGNLVGNQRLNENITETENVVFANVTTIVPALYARNPRVEFTATAKNDEGIKRFATVIERLVNVLAARKSHPGINLKPKAKRGVVTALLTNRAWLEIGWTFKDDSSEKALDDLQRISKELAKAKNPKKIKELEGQLMAIEETIDVLEEEGPFLKYKDPTTILLDPAAQEIDLTDSKWVMVEDMLPTAFIQARYAKKKKGTNDYATIYKPTHILKTQTEDQSRGHDNEQDFRLFDPDADHKDLGFDTEDAYNKAMLTKVWFVWDKTTRRVLLYTDRDWDWPLWVWDDPYQLDRFFPLFPLVLYESPLGVNSKGEVTYYLDQQDAINEMNDEERRARRWARRNIFFNSNIIERDDAEKVLNGPDGTARGVNIPEGMALQDVIGSITTPGFQHKELFDKESKYRAIDRISPVTEVLRGTQFKTNTTEDAVQANVSASNIRVDEKSDQIEDWIGETLWGVAQLCLQFMSQERVATLLGQDVAQDWQNLAAEEISSFFSVQAVGGSTKKPTSAAKKEEALELGQVLGQFVNSAPGPVLSIMLKMMEQAFDEITVTEEDWENIQMAVEEQQQQQQPQPQAGGGAQPAAGGPPQGQPQGAQQGGPPPDPQAIQQLLDTLPTEIKAQVVQQIEAGVDPKQALAQAVQASEQPVQ